VGQRAAVPRDKFPLANSPANAASLVAASYSTTEVHDSTMSNPQHTPITPSDSLSSKPASKSVSNGALSDRSPLVESKRDKPFQAIAPKFNVGTDDSSGEASSSDHLDNSVDAAQRTGGKLQKQEIRTPTGDECQQETWPCDEAANVLNLLDSVTPGKSSESFSPSAVMNMLSIFNTPLSKTHAGHDELENDEHLHTPSITVRCLQNGNLDRFRRTRPRRVIPKPRSVSLQHIKAPVYMTSGQDLVARTSPIAISKYFQGPQSAPVNELDAATVRVGNEEQNSNTRSWDTEFSVRADSNSFSPNSISQSAADGIAIEVDRRNSTISTSQCHDIDCIMALGDEQQKMQGVVDNCVANAPAAHHAEDEDGDVQLDELTHISSTARDEQVADEDKASRAAVGRSGVSKPIWKQVGLAKRLQRALARAELRDKKGSSLDLGGLFASPHSSPAQRQAASLVVASAALRLGSAKSAEDSRLLRPSVVKSKLSQRSRLLSPVKRRSKLVLLPLGAPRSPMRVSAQQPHTSPHTSMDEKSPGSEESSVLAHPAVLSCQLLSSALKHSPASTGGIAAMPLASADKGARSKNAQAEVLADYDNLPQFISLKGTPGREPNQNALVASEQHDSASLQWTFHRQHEFREFQNVLIDESDDEHHWLSGGVGKDFENKQASPLPDTPPDSLPDASLRAPSPPVSHSQLTPICIEETLKRKGGGNGSDQEMTPQSMSALSDAGIHVGSERGDSDEGGRIADKEMAAACVEESEEALPTLPESAEAAEDGCVESLRLTPLVSTSATSATPLAHESSYIRREAEWLAAHEESVLAGDIRCSAEEALRVRMRAKYDRGVMSDTDSKAICEQELELSTPATHACEARDVRERKALLDTPLSLGSPLSHALRRVQQAIDVNGQGGCGSASASSLYSPHALTSARPTTPNSCLLRSTQRSRAADSDGMHGECHDALLSPRSTCTDDGFESENSEYSARKDLKSWGSGTVEDGEERAQPSGDRGNGEEGGREGGEMEAGINGGPATMLPDGTYYIAPVTRSSPFTPRCDRAGQRPDSMRLPHRAVRASLSSPPRSKGLGDGWDARGMGHDALRDMDEEGEVHCGLNEEGHAEAMYTAMRGVAFRSERSRADRCKILDEAAKPLGVRQGRKSH
jgi:hypothetical protein